MTIDELMFKLGIKADTSKLKEFAATLERVENSSAENVVSALSESTNNVTSSVKELNKEINKTKKVAEKSSKGFIASFNKIKAKATIVFGFLSALSLGLARSFSKMFVDIDELSKSKNLLFTISKEEIAQAKEYTGLMQRSGQVIESLKVRIGLGLLPVLSKLVRAFETLILKNDGLVSEGLIGLLKAVVWCVEAVVRFVGATDNVVTSTVGWKVALLMIIAVLAYVKRAMFLAFITNPIFWVVAAIVGLILLIDDLIVYLKGGDAAFGAFWEPAIKWCKKVWDYIKPFVTWLTEAFFSAIYAIQNSFGALWDFVKKIFDIWGVNSLTLGERLIETFKEAFKLIQIICDEAFKFILSLFGLTLTDVDHFIDGLGAAFFKVTDLIKRPFKAAFDWVMSAYDKTVGKVMSGLSWIGESLGLIDKDASSSQAMRAASTQSQSINNRGGDVSANINVYSTDPLKAGESVIGSLNPAYARANRNMGGGVRF